MFSIERHEVLNSVLLKSGVNFVHNWPTLEHLCSWDISNLDLEVDLKSIFDQLQHLNGLIMRAATYTVLRSQGSAAISRHVALASRLTPARALYVSHLRNVAPTFSMSRTLATRSTLGIDAVDNTTITNEIKNDEGEVLKVKISQRAAQVRCIQ